MTSSRDEVPLDIGIWGRSIRPYADWLERLEFDAARHWALRLRSPDLAAVEGAVAEAVAWDFLANRLDDIAPGKLSTGGPDFRCEAGGRSFFVEVTNLSRSAVSEWTSLSEELGGPEHYKDLTGLIKREVSGKAGRYPAAGAPVLVFVTTLHGRASQICVQRAHVEHVLHSTTAIGGYFDSEKGEVVGPLSQITKMELSAFTKSFSIDSARRNISGVLVGGFGTYPDVSVLGVSHPDPVHPFDSSLLEDVPFFEFTLWPPDPRILTRWTLPERSPKIPSLARAWIQQFEHEGTEQ